MGREWGKGIAQRTQRLGKGITEMFIGYTGWRAGGVAGGSGLSEPGYNGWWREGWDYGRGFWGRLMIDEF